MEKQHTLHASKNRFSYNVSFALVWISSTSIGLALTTHMSIQLELFDELYWLLAPIVIGTLQGVILYLRERKFLWSWAMLTALGGALSACLGYVFAITFLLAFPIGMLFGSVTGGALMGLGHGFLLRKFPRSYLMIWVSAIAICTLLPLLLIMSWQVSDSYTDAPTDWEWIRATAIGSALFSAVQVVGLLHVLENPTPFYHPPESELLAKRPLISPAIHSATSTVAFYLLWIASTLFGLGFAVIFPHLLFFTPLVIGILQGLVLACWFRRFKAWMLHTAIGSALGGLLGYASTVLFLFLSIWTDIPDTSTPVFIGLGLFSLVLGLFQRKALKGLAKSKQIIWADATAFGLVLPFFIFFAEREPLSLLQGNIDNLNLWFAMGGTIAAIILQATGILCILKYQRKAEHRSL